MFYTVVMSSFAVVTGGDTARIEQISRSFHKRFGVRPSFIARAPGRVNLIGEHVDYSYVSPSCVERQLFLADLRV